MLLYAWMNYLFHLDNIGDAMDVHSVFVGGKPSSNLADKLEKDEITRLKA
jgi:hypothetical protein